MHNHRITNLDFIRGISVLGILVMNSIIFSLPLSAYWNHSSAGTTNQIDWIIVVISEIFIAQKFMGLFSILFGASIVLFIESAIRRGSNHPKRLSLWRNILLLCFGILHMSFLFKGDVLTIYAICAPIVIVLYKRNLILLTSLSIIFLLISVFSSLLFQGLFDLQGNLLPGVKEYFSDGLGLSAYWFAESEKMGDAIGSFFAIDALSRALGLMLLGVVLYRTSVLQGNLNSKIYIKMIFVGMLIGLPLSIFSISWLILENYKPVIALTGFIPSTLGIIPLTIAYIGILSLLNRNLPDRICSYFRACGKMAFTNYIAQSIIGLIFFGLIFDKGDLARNQIILFVFFVWFLQLWWSKYWLNHFTYGPLELVWRKLTYIKTK